MSCRRLVLVLGDQLDADAPALEGFDPAQDRVWMAEVAGESTHVWTAKPRIAVFLAAMRHFAQALAARGWTVDYLRLDAAGNPGTLGEALAQAIARLAPRELVITHPGEHRVLEMLREAARGAGLPLEVREDTHFFCSLPEFAAHARGRRQLRMEFFYREQRRRHGVLMDGDQPCGGRWNFDAENRASFGHEGPGLLVAPLRFAPDTLTQEVLDLVEARFPDHPGSLQDFSWPVTRKQAREALHDFVTHRLPEFGLWQDAMWTGEPWLNHSLLSSAMNLHLLDPREVVAAAEAAYREGRVPLASAEGFIRQVLGWREYVRGIYWMEMPGYLERNALGATQPLPAWYWTGDTAMACLRDALTQTLRHGYAHHIQRLMVTGLYALLLGVDPKQVHAWYLAVYVDAVEWVELPNTLGMSQYGDGGLMASKPYVASGKYIQRMSNACKGCRYDPARSTGEGACPFTTLYWDFLIRHEPTLKNNQRMAMQLKNVQRLDDAQRQQIAARASALRHEGAAK
ncbi:MULTISPECIES: cryptochrome/photolyase family protein [Ramlibacter]|uniref:Cryptochrome/photolyase family protein n=1 Tax=Ramlibacter aquaticus TaxID=2780094 RepID=A0ABR9SB51_9BURK|nr:MULTISPECIES: cryptochrome/photolyase family protein [Ramlibacter]MBE7939566.1 cryptochrome/photolyase family protein [Ramlibacter aquaticus]